MEEKSRDRRREQKGKYREREIKGRAKDSTEKATKTRAKLNACFEAGGEFFSLCTKSKMEKVG